MKDEDLKIGMSIVIGLILLPVVIGGVIGIINGGIGIANVIREARFNKKWNKRVKEGTAVLIDGQYYGTVVDTNKEA